MDNDDTCTYCDAVDSADTPFECGRWNEHKRGAQTSIGTIITLDTIMLLMKVTASNGEPYLK